MTQLFFDPIVLVLLECISEYSIIHHLRFISGESLDELSLF